MRIHLNEYSQLLIRAFRIKLFLFLEIVVSLNRTRTTKINFVFALIARIRAFWRKKKTGISEVILKNSGLVVPPFQKMLLIPGGRSGAERLRYAKISTASHGCSRSTLS